ncbi:MAG TPA: TIM barrel protein [Steroidobacteraceae bacterium]|jgi:sugar phosphate isomerase/epimerase|nr:TIM barrel protein [Steroidobacteraceae bacterium]
MAADLYNNRLGIERLGVFDMPPVEFVRLVATLGCAWAGIGLVPTGRFNPHNHPAWSLRDDAAMRRELRTALADTGVRIGIVEGFAVVPGRNPRSFDRDLDLVAELGGVRINVVSLDKDLNATADGFALFAELCAARGLQVSAEIGSLGPIGQIDQALIVMRQVDKPNFNLLVDSMHWFRLGNTVEQLAALPAGVVGYAQLCDAPMTPRFDTYLEEAMYERMVPGEGELPLKEFVRCLPQDVIVSLEVPQRSQALRGIGPRERLAACVAAARSYLT